MTNMEHTAEKWNLFIELDEKTKTVILTTANKYLDKNIEFTVNADIVKTVDYTPTISTSKDTSIIYSSVNGKYYLWR